MGIIGAVSNSDMTRSRRHKDTWNGACEPRHVRGWCCSASCNPHAPCAMKGARALTGVHLGAAAGMFSAGCCLLSSTFNLNQSQAPRPACLVQSVVSHRGVCLQLTRVKSSSWSCHSSQWHWDWVCLFKVVLSYSRYDLLALFPPSLQDQETFISEISVRSLK